MANGRMRSRDSGSRTTRYLQLIRDQPGIVSRALAPQLDAGVPPFKCRVRQLKELGLTESLEVGYRLSPRGRAVLKASHDHSAVATLKDDERNKVK